MTIRLFNTLSGQVEELSPSDGKAFRMYACGPTVYDYGHIGNFRTFLQVDVLRRFLRLNGLETRHVMNVTDVDDKIIRNAAAAGLPIGEYTKKYEKAFFEDLDALSVEHPEIVARATEHIPSMVKLIQRLASEDIAYRTDDGSWYFRIAKFPQYGKLSKKDFTGITDGARVDVDEYDKDSARDFALWKAPKPGEYHWETELGPGRPGWHIECSAMAMNYLGDAFDLHAGGEDLMFPHHENEIAQSESASHCTFSRHWFHIRFLLVEGRKMSKSEGNFYTLRDLLLKGYKASAIRLLLISVPYRQQLNFTFEGLNAETGAVERLRSFRERIRAAATVPGLNASLAAEAARAKEGFHAALANDLNTAEARAAIFELVRAGNAAAAAGTLGAENVPEILAVLADFDAVFAVLDDHDPEWTRFALDWAEKEGRLDQASPEIRAQLALTDEQIQALVDERTQAKRTRNFARADQIRNDLASKGILIEDSKDGVRWKRK
ncbi:cysteine--tRNA ligase [Paracidobacterium acidisoli]|uniref:Cysteine--tRNA ligase n=1 Tax=Paracidobacterium acidisoli TaxID=2303751 RepID=A0A372IP46_9BACT|nr:cysteine--tRNA ligase [Paracidobacterium acidisoli]MBT9330937.1 cysteine--tRNA ligase [Paracidobacterium acidisoli]